MKSRMTAIIAVLLLASINVSAVTDSKLGWEDSDTRSSVQSKVIIHQLSPQELRRVLDDHAEWFEAYYQNWENKEAQSDRRYADLTGVSLIGANLAGGNLLGANLTGVNLTGANLTDATLEMVNLTSANLHEANLSGAFLAEANLTRANLSQSRLNKASLVRVNLTESRLDYANLTDVNLSSSNLSGASLYGADLTGAFLNDANLTGTCFLMSNLTGAYLAGADLSKASLAGANLSQAWFEPKLLPDADKIAYAANLSDMRWFDSPQAMVKLRKILRDAGYHQQERMLTYAIEHTQTLRQFCMGVDSRSATDLLEAAFRYLVFELTTQWGMAPGRALRLLIAFIPFFAVLYFVALHRPGSKGIWRVWPTDRIRTNDGTQDMARLQLGWPRALCVGLYFSVLSAFNIGWRELNLGNWIQRLQASEYTLRPIGWVRTVSGIQALISVFLLAMWVLTYFGRPFE